MKIKIFAPAVLVVSALVSSALAAEYQFGVEIPKLTHNPAIYGNTTAYLWVPPAAPCIRGAFIAAANVIERRFCDDPILRAEAARDRLAIVFFNAGWKCDIFQSTSFIPFMQTMLDRLAEQSGYTELRTAPWIPLAHSGNSEFCQAMAQFRETAAIAHFYVPSSNTNGAQQTITFPPIADVTAGTKTISLNATVDSPLPVRYYVSWGPAEVDGNVLRLTEIPAHAKFPIEVKVTAYQWGKATPLACASATAVTRTFFIVGKNSK